MKDNDNVIDFNSALQERRQEEKPLFENRYLITPPLLREFQMAYLRSLPGAQICGALFGLLLCLGIVSVVFPVDFRPVTVTVLFTAPVLWVVGVIIKVYQSGKLMDARCRELHKDRDVEAAIVVNHEFTVFNPAVQEVQHIRFDKVARFLNSRSLYILMLKPGVAVLVKRGAFTVGTDEEFKAFLREKCVNAKGKVR